VIKVTRRIAAALAIAVGFNLAGLNAQTGRRWSEEPLRFGWLDDSARAIPPALVPQVPLALIPADGVRALYVNAWAFGGRRFDDLVRLADSTEINSLVIDVKDDTGYLTYRSEVPLAVAIGANRQLRARDAAQRLATLRSHGIRAIARIVVAKDPLLAARRPAWSVRDRSGGLWRDRLQFAWVDAFNDSVWVYAAQLAAEAAQLGFAEVQFDYVRFPDEPRGRMAQAIFPARRTGESFRDGIARNLHLLRDRVRPLGIPFTIDVFGLTTSTAADLGIGQVWEDLVSTADVVLPMVYPSHYYRPIFGVSRPNSDPYRVVRSALEDGQRRASQLPGPTAVIRPYLQAFTLGQPRYTPAMVRAQIRAAEELGITSWVLWNPRSEYDPRTFRPLQTTVASLPDSPVAGSWRSAR
jgi:hypothetical protein